MSEVNRVGTLLLALWMHASPVAAHESDPITGRNHPLADATPFANYLMNSVLQRAAEATNRRTGCQEDLETTRDVLARMIYKEAGRTVLYWRRGPLRWWGYSRYQLALERGPIERIDFGHRTDIYNEVKLTESPLLEIVGPCSTICIGSTRIGTDKIDHFFGEGYRYYRISDGGVDPEEAIAWGVQSERTIYGMTTTRAFSFADLEANMDGMRFYSDLLDTDSALRLDAQGCVAQVGSWDWSTWIGWEYDELLNPPVMSERLARRVASTIRERRDEFCAGWQPEAARAAYATQWVGAPPRADPFRLSEICAQEGQRTEAE